MSTPIVNDPRNVIRTRRDIVAGMLQGLEGLVVPKTARLMPGETASSVVADRAMSYPILLRGAGNRGDVVQAVDRHWRPPAKASHVPVTTSAAAARLPALR